MGTSEWTQRYGATALVTGASSGIGEQFARQLARKGFNLVLTARREPQLQALKQALEREQGIAVTCILCDLSDPAQVDQLVAQVLPLDIGLVISNAGYGVMKGAYLSVGIDALEAMYRANSLSPARIAHALAYLGVQPHFTPGVRNRALIGLLRWLPRKLAIAMAGYGMRRALDNSASV